ncbi:MAG TPA: nucleotide sugar dehydrogenase [Methylomirabilota bacterium]|jgi:UDP-N-acetyl-D-glucosamine dehydrogenase|nr:nucleotide sugar dehydrogenase [Methylomirabilota bacterium]
MTAAARLAERLAGRPTVGVVGLGYVGLPLAVAFAESGATVIGVDADARRVAGVNAGASFIEDVPAAILQAQVTGGRLTATGEVGALKAADAIVICVPTPLGKSKEPDISYIVAAADAVATIIRAGQLVVLESTTYPGTTQEILLPRFEARGLTAGDDFFLAFSPERIDPGNKQWTLRDIPKVVGGLTPACRELVAALYARITPRVVPVSGPETAEMVKLFENTFRSVNIALVNEFAIMCRKLGISVWEVVGAAATKPFGFMPFWPGPGLGGHCLPSDPYYLSWKVRLEGYEPRFITFADEINRRMPEYVVSLVTDALNERGRAVRGARVLVLGVAYKANVADTRDSPALEIITTLLAKGARLAYHDPHVPTLAVAGTTLGSRPEVRPAEFDVVLVLTAHAAYDWPAIVREAPLVIDTRNATAGVPDTGRVIRL